MRKLILITFFIGVITYALDLTIVRSVSGVWVYGNVYQQEQPGHAYIQQKGSQIRMFMVWTPKSEENTPHYAIDGYISKDVIYGNWSQYPQNNETKLQDFRAEVSKDGNSIRIFGTQDPQNENQLNYIVLSRNDTGNPIRF